MKKEKIKKFIIDIIIISLTIWIIYSIFCIQADKMALNRTRKQERIARTQKNCQDVIIEKDIVGIFLNSSLSGEGSMGGYGFGLLFFGWGNVGGDLSIQTSMNYYFYLKEDDGGLKLSQVSTQNSRIFERDIEVNEAKIRYITEATSSGINCSRNTRYEFIIPRGTIVPFYNLIP